MNEAKTIQILNDSSSTVKAIKEARAFLVGWGRDKDRITFFLWHSELDGKGSMRDPIPISSDKIGEKLVELANEIDKKRGKI